MAEEAILQFSSIYYSVTTHEKKQKEILKGVDGALRAGEMLALMGPSGCGKTSLLNILAGRVASNSRLAGTILLYGRKPTRRDRKSMGFVFQDDLLLSGLTVRETITFSAQLRLPSSISVSDRDAMVNRIIQSLKLESCADSLIGGIGRRGISGGERKRVSIAIELITNPQFLYCDEPTSGLDATTALSLVQILRGLCNKKEAEPMTVVCSIHQPRENLFSLFDKLLLLSQGSVIYFGPTAGAIPYFSRIGIALPPLTNPADFFLDITIAYEMSLKSTKESERTSPDLKEAFRAHALSRAFETLPPKQEVEEVVQDSPDVDSKDFPLVIHRLSSRHSSTNLGSFREQADVHFATSWWTQFRVLLRRSSLQSRGEIFSAVFAMQVLIVAVIASLVWLRSTNIDDITGALFFMHLQQAFNTLLTVTRIFPPERQLMKRERSCGSYRVSAYFMAKSLSDLIATWIFPVIYDVIIYWSVGLCPRADRFFFHVFNFMTVNLCAQSIGLTLSCMFVDFAVINAIGPVVVLLQMLFGGFYVNIDNFYPAISWIKYLSFMYWGFGTSFVNNFRDLTFDCSNARPGEFGPNCPITGEAIIHSRGLGNFHEGLGIGILWIMIIFYRFVAYLFLRFANRGEK